MSERELHLVLPPLGHNYSPMERPRTRVEQPRRPPSTPNTELVLPPELLRILSWFCPPGVSVYRTALRVPGELA